MENLTKELPFLELPSTMWGVHIHPQSEFIGIIHINISNTSLVIDKGIVLFQEKYDLKAKIFLNGFAAYVPNIVLDVRNLSELSALVHLLHGKIICRNVGDNEFSDCLQLLDSELNSDAPYCSTCQNKQILNELTQNIAESLKYDEISISHLKDDICTEYVPEIEVNNDKEYCKLPNKGKKNRSDDQKESSRNEALCNFCGKIFPTGYRIEEHIMTHTQEKPFQCKICLKTFSKSFNLRMHEHTHSGDRPYVCNICGKSYTTSSNLRTHMLGSHTNEKKYVCNICNMAFVYPRYLKLHMRKHTGEKPFVCTACGKKFSKNIHLTIHTRTHTGEKPHCCNVCGRGFTTTGGLGYHKRTHHGNGDT